MAIYEGRKEAGPTTKIFRDRVVSLEQTFELGEKYLDVLTELAEAAFPGFSYKEHDLEHEQDLFILVLKDPEGATKRVFFSRMVLSDSTCLPSLVREKHAPARDRIIAALSAQAAETSVMLRFRQVMNEDDQALADELDGEWRKRQEALAAQRKAEERRRQKQKEKERGQKQRPRGPAQPQKGGEKSERPQVSRPPQASPASPAPQPSGQLQGVQGSLSGPSPEQSKGRGRRRRGRGGQQGQRPPAQPGQEPSASMGGAQPEQRPQPEQRLQPEQRPSAERGEERARPGRSEGRPRNHRGGRPEHGGQKPGTEGTAGDARTPKRSEAAGPTQERPQSEGGRDRDRGRSRRRGRGRGRPAGGGRGPDGGGGDAPPPASEL